MIAWLATVAAAATPAPTDVPVDPNPIAAVAPVAPVVRAITWAQPFTVTEPEPWTMRADRPAITAGWILQLEVEPGSLQARAIDSPVLYAGAWPVRVVPPGERDGCVVVWAPLDRPLAETPVFLGPTTLPERVDAAAAEATRVQALTTGATPLTPAETEVPLTAATIEAVWQAATARTSACR